MRDALYARLLRLSFGYYDRHQTGQLMSRATVDLQTIRFFLGYGLIFFAQHVITIVCVTVVLFFYEWKLALIALAITPLLDRRRLPLQPRLASGPARRAAEARPTWRRSRRSRSSASTSSSRSRRRSRSRSASAAPPTASSTRPCGRTRSARSTCRCSPSCRCWRRRACCSRRATTSSRASCTIGGFFAFNLLLMMLVMPLRMLGMWVGQAQRATASGERFFEVIDEPEEVADAAGAGELPEGPGRVVFAGVGFGYDPARPVLDGHRPRDPGRQHDRADRRLRGRQDDARLARAALLRRGRGAGADRRRRRARRHAALAAARGRGHLAGSVPLLGERPRQHRVRRARRGAGARRGRGPGRAGAPLHRGAARTATTR